MNATDAAKLTKKAESNKIRKDRRAEAQREKSLKANKLWFAKNKNKWFNESVKPEIEEAAKDGTRHTYISWQANLLEEKLAFLRSKGFTATAHHSTCRLSDDSPEQETIGIILKW